MSWLGRLEDRNPEDHPARFARPRGNANAPRARTVTIGPFRFPLDRHDWMVEWEEWHAKQLEEEQ